MNRADFGHILLATALMALAGFVDAVGFLTLKGLFVSFMSGNSTQFALNAGRHDWTVAAPAGALVGLFVAGVVAGRLLGRAAGGWRRPIILLAEAILLAVASFVRPAGFMPAILMTLAMGAQNTIQHRAGWVRTPGAYVTGALVSFGERLADAIVGAGPRIGWAPYLLLWVALVFGGSMGAVAYGGAGLRALFIPAVGAAILSILTGALEGKAPAETAGD
ncbi:MAG TPA: YoaK family protein [Roseiarcus sp.]|nr:YoaK family protein [Roseiarcus sp.]